MAKSYYMLFDVADDYTLSPVDGKYQFGDLAHAKKRAEKLTDKKLTWMRSAASGVRPESIMEWGGLTNGKHVYKIIQRSKNPVAKKKRSAKQRANDKRLGRMAKARAKAARKKTKRKTKRKTAKRKSNPRRKVAKSHLQLVFRCRGSSVMWLTMDTKGKWNWTSDKGKAIRFKTQAQAGSVAKGIGSKSGYAKYQLGACNAATSAATIKAHCSK